MKPSTSVLEAAVIKIFRDVRAMNTGQRLSALELRDVWPRSHFRAEDLNEALASLEAAGVLESAVEEDRLYFALTHQGARRISDVTSHESVWKQMGTMVNRIGIGIRQSTSAEVVQDRRSSDRSGNAP